uniref:Uncharacterized protein n=1 Tax=Panagrolaimus sp. ES5 TaxID=591445 RepID=A0AC34G3Z5_9BILA
MATISSPKNLPTNSELLELIKKQDDVINELSKQLEQALTKNTAESESSGDEISEALSVNQKLLIEMKNKLKESVEIMEQLQEKNVSLSLEIKQLRDTQLGFSPASESLFEMHNLLENERVEIKRIQEELFAVKRSEQKKDGIIVELEGELERTRKLTNSLNDEMKKRIEDLLKEVGEKSSERNAAMMEKKEAEEKLEAFEENYKLKTTLLEEHCKKLSSEIGILTKKKIFLNERI